MTVSIIIPTYNRPALLQRAVASALAACPQDGEVIVVDDRSDTAIKALRDVTDPRLRITTNTGDKGAAGARNHGIAQAKGDIVMFNSHNPHEWTAVDAGQRRMGVSTYLGRMPDGNFIYWS